MKSIKLSELAEIVSQTIYHTFEGESFWVSAKIMNVKKYTQNRRCYLTLEDHENGIKTSELKAVFWSNYYHEIENFERITKQVFKDGLEIICRVNVRFHKIYGLNLDVIQIDLAHTIGTLEIEKQKTLDELVKLNPLTIKHRDGKYLTLNNQLPLPTIIKRIALITAPNSDGQRDFIEELRNNKHNYSFTIQAYLCTIQGEQASKQIMEQLNKIFSQKDAFDLVAIVRGGGSLGDFKNFDSFDLANQVANFPIPIFTGIGHDRNQSIVDLMAREFKTPTKVATQIVEHNFDFENAVIDLKNRVANAVENTLYQAKESLQNAKRIINLSSPDTILKRGFAIIKHKNKIIVDPKKIQPDAEIETHLQNEIIISKVISKK